mgnify:CR=1 FL=1
MIDSFAARNSLITIILLSSCSEKIALSVSLDVNSNDIFGDDISGINYGFTSKQNTFASRGQKLIYWGPMKPLEKLLLQSPIVPWAFFASNLYHNGYWLNFIGKRRIKKALQTPWGKLFSKY